MENQCRICRQTGDSAHLNSMMITGLLEVYSFCTNIPVTEDNEKCYKICDQCGELLIRFNEFKKLCIESDNYFKNNIFQTEIKVEFADDPLQSLNKKSFVKDEDQDDSDHFVDDNDNDSEPNKKRKAQHECEYCSKKFVYVASLKKHYLKCNKSPIRDDKVNAVANISKEEIKEEFTMDETTKKYICLTCGKAYSNLQPYKIHLRTHTGERPFECLYCGEKYADPAYLKIHTQKVHLKTTEYSCHICPKIFFTTNDLRRHISRHTKRFECNLCEKKFTAKYSLNKHIKNHSNLFDNKCNICKEQFSNRTDYRNHIMTHMEDDPYKCKLCEMDFIYLNSFKMHVKENHPGKQNEECIENPQHLLFGNDTFNEAMPSRIVPEKRRTATDESEKKYICNICGKRFMSNFTLDEHIRVHTGEKPFPCDKCDFKCRNKSQLSVHQQRKHEKMPRFNCSLCSYQAYTSHRLKIHMLTHYNEKPFVCDVCDASFKLKKSLKVHKRGHTGEKPFQCTYCDKAFASPSYLKDHLTVHTGEKRFSCDICDKKFSQRTPLAKHMELHKNGNMSIKSRTITKHPEMKSIDAFSF